MTSQTSMKQKHRRNRKQTQLTEWRLYESRLQLAIHLISIAAYTDGGSRSNWWKLIVAAWSCGCGPTSRWSVLSSMADRASSAITSRKFPFTGHHLVTGVLVIMQSTFALAPPFWKAGCHYRGCRLYRAHLFYKPLPRARSFSWIKSSTAFNLFPLIDLPSLLL